MTLAAAYVLGLLACRRWCGAWSPAWPVEWPLALLVLHLDDPRAP